MQRRLSAILSADVVGFSRLMEIDEADTLSRLKSLRREVIDPCIASHNGRIVKLMGDGALVEFASVVNAVDCAISIQRGMLAAEPQIAEDDRVVFRIGVNLGDIMVDGEDIYGDGVNVAERLQSLAGPGGVAVSGTVREHVRGKLAVEFEDYGEHSVKNIETPVRVYMARVGASPASRPRSGAVRAKAVSGAGEAPSIAVLPFTNMSGDAEQEYFSDGITEDIITDLSKVSALAVTARNTVFTFKGRAVLVKEVADALKVGFVLEGSVRKAESRVRITAQLIDGKDGRHIWAERYDRDLDDIFALQDEISKSIVDALKVKLLPKELETITSRPTSSPEAYQIYLMARSFFNRGHEARNMKAARHLFAQALEVDPAYARAYAGMADCDSYLLLANDSSATFETVWANATRALELDPGLADAHASRGLALFTKRRHAEAEAEFLKAIELDPNSFEAHFFYGRNCHVQGRLEEAADLYRRTIAVKPDDFRAWDQLRAVYVSLGRHGEAEEAARECLKRIECEIDKHPDEPILLCYGATLLADLGDEERGAEWTARAAALAGDDLRVLYNLACCYAKLGMPDPAIDCLERQSSGSPLYLGLVAAWMKQDSDLDPLRSHPRYVALMQRIDAQVATAKA
jgi:adenylate cyclase